MDSLEKQLWAEFIEACSTVRDIDGDAWGTITFENFKTAIKRNALKMAEEK